MAAGNWQLAAGLLTMVIHAILHVFMLVIN
jgi:hypothetical protein